MLEKRSWLDNRRSRSLIPIATAEGESGGRHELK
jgi:hypothetical protein